MIIIAFAILSLTAFSQPKHMNKTESEIKQFYAEKAINFPETFEIDTIRTTKKGVLIVEYRIKDATGIDENVKMFFYFNNSSKVYKEVMRTLHNTYWEEILLLKLNSEKPTPTGTKIFLDKTMEFVYDKYYLGDNITMEIVPDFEPHLDIIYKKVNME